MTTVYGIPNCDTVKRARQWLDAQGVPYTFHDFKKQGVPAAALDGWIDALGWEALVNRRGTTWRKLAPERQAAVVDAASARAVLFEHPSLIRRPVVEWPVADGAAGPAAATVGFDAEAWAARLCSV